MYCHFACVEYTPRQRLRDERPACGYTAFSLGLKPGPVVFCFVEGSKGSVTSQIAVKMALDAMRDRALAKTDGAGDIVQAGFREANRRVYEYGAKMLAGAKIAARGLAFSFDGRGVVIGRTGDYESFLLRGGRMMRFYLPGRMRPAGDLERFLGAGKQVLVDLATVSVEVGDWIVVTSLPWSTTLEEIVTHAFLEAPDPKAIAANISAAIGAQLVTRDDAPLEENIVTAVVHIDQAPIMLEEVAEDEV